MFQMEIIEGKRKGSQLYVYNNYIYYADKRYNNIYRCSKRKSEKCPAVLNKEGDSYSLKHKHNHSKEQYIVEIHKMKKEMIRLSKETTKSFKHIFDTVCSTNLRVAPYISYNNMKSILSRHRTTSRPNIPNDLHTLYKQLDMYTPTSNIYKGYATSSDNKIALIFSNDILLNALSEACEIFVDGTLVILFLYILCFNYFFLFTFRNISHFQIVPKKPSPVVHHTHSLYRYSM